MSRVSSQIPARAFGGLGGLGGEVARLLALLALGCDPGSLSSFSPPDEATLDGAPGTRDGGAGPEDDGGPGSDAQMTRPDGMVSPPGDAGCTPACEGRACGDDGCGGRCGTCAADQTCDPGAGLCIDTAGCGNGRLDPGEVCDGDCPTSCPAAGTCARTALMGSAAECTAQCVTTDQTRCANGDGCCPAGCNEPSDGDCAPVCGNGVRESGERCDGDCPTSCSSSACTTRSLVGTGCQRRCEASQVTSCVHGDGCCPSGCSVANDDDCNLDCTDLGSWPADWAAAEVDALNEMNRHRSTGYDCASGPKMSVPAYTMNDPLRIAARCHSQDMADNGFFSHTGSDGSNFVTRVGRTSYTGGARYENIAAGNATGVPTVGQWMSSTTGHCDAVMASNANEVGIGYYRRSGTRYTHYWTAVMGRR